MTTPSDSQPREAGFFTAIRRWGLTRGDNGFMGGVVDGLAQRVGMATVPARIIVVVAAIFLNGIVLLGYAGAWALLPDRRGNIIIQNFGRGMPNVGALIGIGILSLFGLGGIDNGVTYRLGDFPLDNGGPWRVMVIIAGVLVPLAIVGGIVWLIVVLARRSGQAPATGGEPPVYAAMPGQATHPVPPSPASPSGATSAGDGNASAPSPMRDDAAAGPASEPRPDTDEQPLAPASPAVPTQAPAHSTPHHAYAYAPVPPAPPVRPRIPGPGKGFYLATLGWAILAVAGVAYADRQDELVVHPFVAWFVTCVTGLGVLLVLVSLSGRKLGFLGFLGIMAALPTVAIAASADDLREAYARNESIITIDIATHDDQGVSNELDATPLLSADYTEVIVNGSCYEGTTIPSNPASTARLSYAPLEADTTVDIITEVTYISIPKGADVTVRGIGDAQAHVVWATRDVTCDFYGAGGEHLRLANNTGPTLDLVVRDDEFANTIVLTEVPS